MNSEQFLTNQAVVVPLKRRRNHDAIKVKFDEISAQQLAEQLTLMELEMVKRIRPREFLNQAWNSPEKMQISPNLVAFIEWFQQVRSKIIYFHFGILIRFKHILFKRKYCINASSDDQLGGHRNC